MVDSKLLAEQIAIAVKREPLIRVDKLIHDALNYGIAESRDNSEMRCHLTNTDVYNALKLYNSRK
jgi:hypothetical protein